MGFESPLSGSPGDVERRMRALEGESFSFDEAELRERLKAKGLSDTEIDITVQREKDKIEKANQYMKAKTQEEESESAADLLSREMEKALRERPEIGKQAEEDEEKAA